ncbi:MarR family winged helix-turn-helix transcriptional regulator [Polynucleobacter sp. UB-Tiil-W10]|uniref:MarR family winged helix-turn-helix transcriptional regulator n=1 Tax=Polynucleobacter sp. UB-Tiil-W10 TaxID=1855648 RepID=UPI001C0BE3E1|nr:MarR family transcriptional regulator [Polynucleobacter sp. UB-Tiil-W10]MBU3540043.1 MarR family transcriptional regulator [Polynucleobacter sp. UB-Tiil-W10]
MNFLPSLRNLVSSYQAFERYSAPHIKGLGLTLTQFDVIATLGNQPPMSCKQLGEKTLVTKGTLTGVLERLEVKGLIQRQLNAKDARSQLIGLTQEGQALFEKVFPVHLEYLNQAFKKLTPEQLKQLEESLKLLKDIF